jgi:hypothetical protein
MKIENIDEYIKYRFKRAEESLDDALLLTSQTRHNDIKE